MAAVIDSKFRALSIKGGLLLFLLSIIAFASGVVAFSQNTQDKAKEIRENAPSQKKLEAVKSFPMKELIPMPSGKLDIALAKVESTRDPFQEAPVTESSNINLLGSAIEFRGIAKSGNTLKAIIKTKKGQKFYKVGDRIENGFIIEQISDTEVTADISNGIRNYRLSIEKFSFR